MTERKDKWKNFANYLFTDERYLWKEGDEEETIYRYIKEHFLVTDPRTVKNIFKFLIDYSDSILIDDTTKMWCSLNFINKFAEFGYTLPQGQEYWKLWLTCVYEEMGLEVPTKFEFEVLNRR